MSFVKAVFLLSFLTSILHSQYFYTNNKKIFLKPANNTHSRSTYSNKRLFTIENTREEIGVYDEVIFKIKDKKYLQDIKKDYNFINISMLSDKVYKVKIPIDYVFDISNKLYEDSRVDFAHPDVDVKIKPKNMLTNPLSKYAGFLRALELEELWKIAPKKGDGVAVAVMDTHIDIKHPDLRDNVIEQYIPTVLTNSNPNHGTNCIGIIAASDNDVGSVGISPKSRFYAITISPRLSEVIMGLGWASKKNVGVLSNSWGTVLYDGLSDALRRLSIEGRDGKGTIIVFASGNSNINYDINPAVEDQSELDFVIGVGATNTLGEKTNYSNYGDMIDIYAFGGDSISGLITTTLGDKYTGRFGGTSASAPVVSGVIALMLSIDPDLSFHKIKDILMNTADITPLGYKRLNAKKALLMVRDGESATKKDDSSKSVDKNISTEVIKSDDIKKPNIEQTVKIPQSILSIDGVKIGKGWNMLGTSFDINTMELHKRYEDVIIYTQNRDNLETIEYTNEPLLIKAGEGFWVYKH